MKKSGKLILGIIQLIVAVGALPAGYLLFSQPDGHAMHMSVDILEGSPFKDFFIPGLFLFIVNGVFNMVSSVLAFLKYRHTALLGLLLGFILIVWIAVQVYSVGLNHILQPLYFVIGLGEILLSFFILKGDRKRGSI